MNIIKEKFSKDSKGKIIILEGLWNTGKTTLCEYLQKFHDFSFVKEPNHVKAKIRAKTRRDITSWYFKKHFQNLEKAFRLTQKGENVVIERSPISAIAFAKTFFSKNLFPEKEINTMKNKMKYLLKSHKNNAYLIFLKHLDYSSLINFLSKDKLMVAYAKLEFLEKFEKCLISFCNLFGKNNFFIVIKLNSTKHLIKNFENIIKKIL